MYNECPIPFVFKAKTLSQALKKYQTFIDNFLAERLLNDEKWSVHTLQITSPNTVVCFVCFNEAESYRQEAMLLMKKAMSQTGNAGCEHQWGANLVCEKCGATM